MYSHGLRHRAYRGEDDLQRLLDALSRAHATPGDTGGLFHPGDLVWALYQNMAFDPRQSIELWESDGGELVGFCIFEEADFETQCFASDGEMRRAFELAALGVARERALAAGGAQLRTLNFDTDAAQRELLGANGFAVDEARVTRRGEPRTGMLQLAQPLADAGEAARGASDFVVRQVGGEEEWAARVELHRTVWAPSRVTVEAYRRLRAAPVYRPDLDLVAVAPDGRFASYAIIWYDAASRVGEFEPVGTHPDFRRRGASRAVLREGLRRLRALGARRALVMSSAQNPAAVGLYQSAGFEVVDRGWYYRAQV
jgi:mycothiol synthase